ncbi:MAG TPA: hypothetical protein VNW04_23590 [Puia sp.]|jgi:hypothetical protein|nr:hypothetical protein [Puia sp.]
MGALKKYSPGLKAATILETMVALVILVVIFGIAITLFIRVGAGPVSLKRVQAEQLLNDFSNTTRRQGEFVDADRRVNGYTLRRRVTAMDDHHTLWRIHYYIYDRDGQLLLEWQQLVLERS